MVFLVNLQTYKTRSKQFQFTEESNFSIAKQSQVQMDGEGRNGSVKSAVASLYGARLHDGNWPSTKPHKNSPEQSLRARDIHHQTITEISVLNDSKRVADSARAQAESELSSAKKIVRDLTSRIEESGSKAKAQTNLTEKLKKSSFGSQGQALDVQEEENYQYVEVMRELGCVKQELRTLKLDVAAVLQEKRRAEKLIEASTSKLESYSSSVEALKTEIEDMNEEHVLVELARIEAVKEFGAIEAQRKEEAKQYSSALAETREKMKGMIQEIDNAKEIENKLALTIADVNMLHGELMQMKQMERKEEFKYLPDDNCKKEGESDSPSLLQSVTQELEAAKKELASVREEGFQFMASMDVIRGELRRISEEIARLKQKEEKSDLTVQNLNTKLLRANAKLEAASAAEEKAKSIVSTISLTLQQLKTEAEAAKKESLCIMQSTASIKAEAQKAESDIESTEEKLQDALEELEVVKASEAQALDNLKTLIEGTMRSRASASQRSSTISISKFEYEYLTGHAAKAEEIADKKVGATQAWIEALKASEKEIKMKIEATRRNIRELRVAEEPDVYQTKKTFSAKRVVERESRNRKRKQVKDTEVESLPVEEVALPPNPRPINRSGTATPKKSMNRSGNTTPARRAKFRKSAPPAVQSNIPRSTSFTIRRKRNVMPNFAKFFGGRKTEKDLASSLQTVRA